MEHVSILPKEEHKQCSPWELMGVLLAEAEIGWHLKTDVKQQYPYPKYFLGNLLIIWSSP
jgi:hypothetical protein